MDLDLIQKIVIDVCRKYEYEFPKRILLTNDIKFFGLCVRKEQTIKLKAHLCENNPIELVTDLIKHELIHFRIPNHGPEFVKECKRMGISRHTRFDHTIIVLTRGMYKFKCNACIEKNTCNKIKYGCAELIERRKQ